MGDAQSLYGHLSSNYAQLTIIQLILHNDDIV